VSAFGAAEKLRRSLIAAAGLHLPHINFHVTAFGAFHAHFRHGVNFVVFTYRYDLLLKIVFDDFGGAFGVFFFTVRFGVAAFTADKRNARGGSGGYKTCTASRTKLHNKSPKLSYLPFKDAHQI
jgi:hypothetical protein